MGQSTLFFNGRINTLDRMLPPSEAMLVADGLIAAAGDSAELLRQAPPDARRIGFQNRCVVPGLNHSLPPNENDKTQHPAPKRGAAPLRFPVISS